MWSIAVSGMALQLAAPVVEEPMRTPSTSTMLWLLLAPRMKTLDGAGAAVAGDLDAALALQQVDDGAGARFGNLLGADGDGVADDLASGCGVRVAVTTTVSAGSACA
jgi:hypothetical protein